MEIFSQAPPQLANQFDDDRVLKAWLERHLPPDARERAVPRLREMGALAAGDLWRQQLAELRQEPELIQWDPWGRRIDRIVVTPLWQRARSVAATSGLVATAYEPEFQPDARVVQFALVYLFHPSTDVYSCPLAMSDGAARALLAAGNEALIERAVGRLTSRDPRRCWTSGQWMTETTGGSDVGGTQTLARQDADGVWRLSGKKWFSSAATSEMALTLARVASDDAPGGPLALFYLEPRDREGHLKHIRILRLKDKLGTRKLPTAELELDGTPAIPVRGLDGGVRLIAPMLNMTRTWNAVCAISLMRRALALARDYANRRIAFGRPLAELPLHCATLAALQAEFEAAFQLVFHMVRLLGLDENGRLGEPRTLLLRLLVPLAKLFTGKQAVAVISESIECLGGAGYLEDTGLPVLLRDAQVLPIWEGTTNVLSLDVLRVLDDPAAGAAYLAEVEGLLEGVSHPDLATAAEQGRRGLERLRPVLHELPRDREDDAQGGARSLALSMARLLSFALLLEDASHALVHRRDPRPATAARRFAAVGLVDLSPADPAADRMLATDIYA